MGSLLIISNAFPTKYSLSIGIGATLTRRTIKWRNQTCPRVSCLVGTSEKSLTLVSADGGKAPTTSTLKAKACAAKEDQMYGFFQVLRSSSRGISNHIIKVAREFRA